MNIRSMFSIAFVLIGFSIGVDAQTISTWEEMGPISKPVKLQNNTWFSGIGLMSTVEVDPLNANIIYAGAAGGMWRSDDQGNNWQGFLNQREFDHTVSVGTIEVDNSNSNFIYIGTGMKSVTRQKHSHGADQTSDGVYRCQLVGQTKVLTKISNGLPDPLSNNPVQYDAFSSPNGIRELGYYIHVLKQSPFDPNTLYAGTSVGLYYTTNVHDANPVWNKVVGIPLAAVRSIEFTSGSTAADYTCYVTGDRIAYTTHDFLNWNNLLGTCEGCLNKNDPYYLNALSYDHDPNPYDNIYDIRITDSISRTTFYACPSLKYPNRMFIGMTMVDDRLPFFQNGPERYEAGVIARFFMQHEVNTWTLIRRGSNSSYNPMLAVAYKPSLSPYETIGMGFEYIELLREQPNGTYVNYLNYNGYYTQSNKYSHGDIQDLKLSQDGLSFYVANDGMISKFDAFSSSLSESSAWLPIDNNGLSAANAYFVDVHPDNPGLIAAGFMHNHITINDNGAGWKSSSGGDGLEVSFTKNDGLLFFLQGGSFYRITIPGLVEQNSVAPGYGCNTWWFRSLYRDPKTPQKSYYVGGYYISETNKGSYVRSFNGMDIQNPLTLADLPALGFWGDPSAMAISPSDNNYIYVAFSPPWFYPVTDRAFIVRTANSLAATPSWVRIPMPSAYSSSRNWLKAIAVSDLDPKTLFIAYYDKINDGRPRVYMTKDEGQTWVDYNNSASTIPGRYKIHSLLYEKGSNDGLYAGTDAGVYYTNRNMTGWILYSQGLPKVAVTEMVYHPKVNKIIAATWGRGIWQVSPYCVPQGDLIIDSGNISLYNNKPNQVNGSISYSVNTTGSPSRTELRASKNINLLPGTFFVPSNATYTMDAYITTCSGMTSLKQEATFEEVLLSSAQVQEEEVSAMESQMMVYPNPSTEASFSVYIGNYINEKITIKLCDLSGAEMFRQDVMSPDRHVHFVPDHLSPGAYVLRVMKDSKVLYSTKVIFIGTAEKNDLDAHK